MQRASCAIPGLHKWKLEGQREPDSSSGREVAAGTAEELQKHFALFPAKMGTREEGRIWVGSRLSKGLHYWLNFFHTETLQNLGKEAQNAMKRIPRPAVARQQREGACKVVDNAKPHQENVGQGMANPTLCTRLKEKSFSPV